MNQFHRIDPTTWKRLPYYNHYLNQLRCTFSITVNLDITSLQQTLKEQWVKLYPVLIYSLAKVVNSHEEFRTSTDKHGNVGIWEKMHPSYTLFHKESETFSEIWTPWCEDLPEFINRYRQDVFEFGDKEGICPKPQMPENTFPISSLPWSTFTGFNLNIFGDGSYLLPIFTWGKYFKEHRDGKDQTLIPLSIQVHHAVCDGYHVSRFINELQCVMNSL